MDAFDLRQWEGFAPAGGSLTEPVIIDQIAIDSRRIDSSHALFVALKGEKEDGHDYVRQAAEAGAKFALVSHVWEPSCSYPDLTLLRVDSPLQAFQAIAKAYRLQLPTKIIGITGSFGKTMVKDLLYALLGTEKRVAASPESFNSQIGVALSLLTLRKQHDIAVIEAAISHKQEMDVLVDLIQPDFTILTPIGKKHLATLQDIQTLIDETVKLVKATPLQGWSLLPRDPQLEKYGSHFPCSYFFWNEPYAELPHASPLPIGPLSGYQISFPDAVTYQGNIETGYAYFLNLLNMASKAAWLMGISSSQIISVLQTYQPEPTRTEIWKSPLGAIFVNETYCSDPQSVDHALRHFEYASLENRKVFVFGGMRGQLLSSQTDYRRIGKVLAKSNIRHLLLVGPKPFKPLIEEVQRSSNETEILAFDNYEETFSYLQNHLKSEDLIIFKGETKLSLDVITETFNDSIANNQCVINLAAIQANLALIRKRLPDGTRLMVIVKALAYGTDEVRMAKFLANCEIDILGVSYVDEGVALRRAGVRQAIFSINATPYETTKVVKWDLEVGVSDSQLITALAKEAAHHQKRIKVHLHVNTGMGRFGCRPEEACELAHHIHSLPSLELEGLMTHFACAEDPREDDFTRQQIACFDSIIAELREQGLVIKWVHAANSSGSLRFHLPQYNMVRLGLAVYGLYVSEAAKTALDLRLALSLTSRIVGINICKKGETISYGRRYRVSREMQKIAVLPIGYFDGLHRHYSEKAHVLIRGQQAPMVGNICMDYMMVDVTDIPHVAVGDKVLIFGEDEFGFYLSPEELASSGDSIIHELMTCLGPRIQRIFVYEEGKQIR
jgi:alanine racemase/UDP-N-acetylmuramoyl-tripeptide--D-alanyl-D-alanine ligase